MVFFACKLVELVGCVVTRDTQTDTRRVALPNPYFQHLQNLILEEKNKVLEANRKRSSEDNEGARRGGRKKKEKKK